MNAPIPSPLPLAAPERVSGLERRLGLDAVLAAVIPEPRPPSRIGRFEIVERIGAGSMGLVFRAFDADLDREVAIKVTRRSCRRSTRDRVRHEARALARVTHPNVVGVYEIGCHEDELYVVMELVDGRTLETWARGRGCAAVLDACVQAGQGLAAAHRAGVVHCDFKPENVLVGRDGRVRVVDFGLAKVHDGVGPGLVGACTPHFSSPEVLAGELADARSDQFSYCRSVLELTAHCPIGRLLEPALARGCSEDPADRWPDMDALLDALLAAVG